MPHYLSTDDAAKIVAAIQNDKNPTQQAAAHELRDKLLSEIDEGMLETSQEAEIRLREA